MKSSSSQSLIHGELRRDEQAGSAKQFGWVFTAVFAVVALLPTLHGAPLRGWALMVATVFAVVAWLRPQLLQPLNAWWHKFGLLLHHVVSPIVMGVMFFGVLTPMALIMRGRGKTFLALTYDKKAKSYWVKRTPAGPAPETFIDQF